MKSWMIVAGIVVVLVLGSTATFLLGRAAPDPGSTTRDGSPPASSATMPSAPAASPTATGSSAAPSPSAEESGSHLIETTSRLYAGLPYETIEISGRYHGVSRATELRVRVRHGGDWQTYPLPVMTSATGSFRAYVELGPGRYRLRLEDLAADERSAALTLMVF